jgi:hypothetical protein
MDRGDPVIATGVVLALGALAYWFLVPPDDPFDIGRGNITLADPLETPPTDLNNPPKQIEESGRASKRGEPGDPMADLSEAEELDPETERELRRMQQRLRKLAEEEAAKQGAPEADSQRPPN